MQRGETDGTAGVRGRRLKTAAETLQALKTLGAHREGLRVQDLAAHLNKSEATARYLLNTLCGEGFAVREAATGRYRLHPCPPWTPGAAGPEPTMQEPTAGTPAPPVDLPPGAADAVTELYRRTRQRAYLAAREGDDVRVLHVRGHQGLARIPGLRERIPPRLAHATAVSKALIAFSPATGDVPRPDAGFERFTAATITDPRTFARELARTRRAGFAVDREEFAEGFCCIAAPILAPDGRAVASLGISVLARRFAADHRELAEAVVTVAAAAGAELSQTPGHDPEPRPRQDHRQRPSGHVVCPAVSF